jgi:peptidoglycan/LPS O-acetylase OafA/YrhL
MVVIAGELPGSDDHDPPANATEALPYLPQLDGLRAIAVMAVVLAHATASLEGGGIGVDVFFVLSGYLITTQLLQEHAATGQISFRGFYLRRIRRLLPALVTAALVTTVAYLIVRPPGTRSTLYGVAAALLYVSCWLRAYGISQLGSFGHSWSLSIEEHFYLVWPPLLWAMSRRWPQRIAECVVGAFVVSVIYRLVSMWLGVAPTRLNNAPDLRAHQLLAGCALATVLVRRPARGYRWERWWWLVTGLALLDLARDVVAPYALGVNWYRTGSVLIGLEAAVLVGFLAVHGGSRLSRALSTRPLVWTGLRSYGIYLWHLPLIGLVDLTGRSRATHVTVRLALIGVTFTAAALSYRFVERRFHHQRGDRQRTNGVPPRLSTSGR